MLTLQAQVREKSMLQIKQDESRDAGAGKRKALGLEDGAGRKRANLGEGDDVDARIDKGKLKEALEGKSSSFAGKEVTEEDMGTSPAASRDQLTMRRGLPHAAGPREGGPDGASQGRRAAADVTAALAVLLCMLESTHIPWFPSTIPFELSIQSALPTGPSLA